MSDAPMSRPGEVAGWPKLVVTYSTDEANVAPLLPPGLTPLEPVVTIGIYCVPILGEPEYGISVKVPAAWQGVAGQYNLGMGIDQEAAVFISGELNGQPKFLCDIDYYRLGDHVGARATHQGYTFVEFSGDVTGEAAVEPGDIVEHEWWTKYSRAIGGAEKQYDFPPHVVDVATTFEQVHVEDLDGDLRLLDSPWDPVARYLPMGEMLSARLVTHRAKARDITNAGPLDPDAFWPHADVIGGSRWPGDRGGPRR
ncbi:MAG: acetoacetate decarboxylase family protein [Acidimicrobiia bacterium]|nr:acetoacetate decarboxylase family protein [Acidimicrobiia bacterium]